MDSPSCRRVPRVLTPRTADPSSQIRSIFSGMGYDLSPEAFDHAWQQANDSQGNVGRAQGTRAHVLVCFLALIPRVWMLLQVSVKAFLAVMAA